jgi:glycine betaine/choline ABC-type transport system substrate-binding protein
LSALRSLAVGAAATLVVAVPALGAGTPLRLADTGTTPSRVFAELATQALTAQGFAVTRTSATSPLAAAADLTAGVIDAYTTDTATLLERVLAQAKQRNDATLTTSLTTLLAARAQVPAAIDVADDAPQVACRKQVVSAHKLTGLVSLGKAAKNLSYAAPAAHLIRADGLPSLRVTFRRVVRANGTTRFDLIAKAKVHCVLSSGAEARSAKLNLVALRDLTRRLAGTPRHDVLVTSQAYVGAAPAPFTPTLTSVAGLVTTDVLRSLVGKVELDAQDPTVVAQEFLRTNGIIP